MSKSLDRCIRRFDLLLDREPWAALGVRRTAQTPRKRLTLRFLGNFDQVAFEVAHLEETGALAIALNFSDGYAA